MHGNRTVDKDDFVRGLLAAMRDGETVGILMDTNMTPPQGVFVDFLTFRPAPPAAWPALPCAPMPPWFPASLCGIRSCASTSLRFDPAVELVRTGDDQADIVANTAKFTKVIEDYVRRYPDQWLMGSSPLENTPRRPTATVLKAVSGPSHSHASMQA